MPIRTIIIDDEPHAIDILKKYASQIPDLEVIATCNNALEAFRILQNAAVDLMLADIKMPGLSGTDLVRSLKTPPPVIFTTAYHEYAVEGFDLNAIDYLVKPIPLNRFLRAIDKVMHHLKGQLPTTHSDTQELEAVQQKQTHYFYIRIDRQTVKLDTREICWIESIKDYIKVMTPAKTYVTKQKISIAEKLLPFGQFMRVHRSFIVPVHKVAAFHPQYLLVAGTRIPVGRNYKEVCTQQFGAGNPIEPGDSPLKHDMARQ